VLEMLALCPTGCRLADIVHSNQVPCVLDPIYVSGSKDHEYD